MHSIRERAIYQVKIFCDVIFFLQLEKYFVHIRYDKNMFHASPEKIIQRKKFREILYTMKSKIFKEYITDENEKYFIGNFRSHRYFQNNFIK